MQLTQIIKQLILGETSSTAYRGDRGKTAYDHSQSAHSTNDFSNDLKNKLDGIETAADVTDAANIGSAINTSTAKTTMVDADKIAIVDTEASNILKTLSWAYIKSILKTYFDGLYQTVLSLPLAIGMGGTGNTLGASSQVLFQHTQVSVTGTTNEQNLFSGTLPANALGANSVLRITFMFSYTNSASSKILRIKFGGTTWFVITVTTTLLEQTKVEVRNRNSQNSQIGYAGQSNTQIGPTVNIPMTATIDCSQGQSIYATGQLTNMGEIISLESISVEVLK